jgi:hypothetical protein
LARRVIDFGLQASDLGPGLNDAPPGAVLAAQPGVHADLLATQHDLSGHWPAGLAPTPAPITPAPDPEASLPRADYVVITWTVAELAALADVFTAGMSRDAWHRYSKGYEDHYKLLIRSGAPAHAAQRLGSYMPTTIGDKTVLCVKSELHLNQDGISTGDGTATLPVRDFFAQIIAETQPKLVITTGTAGATYADHELGDVIVTRAAKFRAHNEFRNEPWANQKYLSDWTINTDQFDTAAQLLALHADRLTEPDFAPPTSMYTMPGGILPGRHNTPDIKLDGRDFEAFHPILTTDYFEFGTSTNNLAASGCGVEMGDAVLGMVANSLPAPPRWVVVRNASDPRINGHLPTTPDVQAMWAVWYYETYGYWTTISSAITCWAIIAADST